MGRTITGWLEDPAIVEIMLNPDRRLWIDRRTCRLCSRFGRDSVKTISCG
jgi:Flp pilus assembly CpaF family ATPase